MGNACGQGEFAPLHQFDGLDIAILLFGKECTMKISTVWRGNKPAPKKKRAVPKLRIRWTQLGLVDPSLAPQETSMDQIRRDVTALASSGFGAETRARSEQTLARPKRAHVRTGATRSPRRMAGT